MAQRQRRRRQGAGAGVTPGAASTPATTSSAAPPGEADGELDQLSEQPEDVGEDDGSEEGEEAAAASDEPTAESPAPDAPEAPAFTPDLEAETSSPTAPEPEPMAPKDEEPPAAPEPPVTTPLILQADASEPVEAPPPAEAAIIEKNEATEMPPVQENAAAVPAEKQPLLQWCGLSSPPYDLSGGLGVRLYFVDTLNQSPPEGVARYFPEYWNLWQAQLLDGATGDLVHPVLGPIRARVKGEYEIRSQVASGIVVDVTFVEAAAAPESLVSASTPGPRGEAPAMPSTPKESLAGTALPPRPGYLRCRVIWRVSAKGYSLGGHLREHWMPDEIGDFAPAVVASVPHCFTKV